jgi:phospholipase A1
VRLKLKRFCIVLSLLATPAVAESPRERCLLDQLGSVPAGTSVEQIRAACDASDALPSVPEVLARPSVVSRRLKEEEEDYSRAYALTAYRMNYILPLAYDQHRPSSEPYRNDVAGDAAQSQKIEAKYQLSFKFPLLQDLFGGPGDLVAGYTQRSFWQMYNTQASRPFRETNYEPEIWYQHPIGQDFAGWNLVSATIGLNHQSNGRAQEYSRSWNRLMSSFIFERGDSAVMLRPWLRVKENSDDDNPDINHYLGNFDLSIGRKIGRQSFELTVRNNLQGRGNRGALQLGWSFPLPKSPRMRGYVQWFNGYGESLIDYNVRQNTLGVGLMLADW